MATEVGSAYVSVIPKTDGFSSTVAEASKEAGQAGGTAASGGIMDSLKSTMGSLFGQGGEMGSSLMGGMESFMGGAGKFAIGAAVAAIGVEAIHQMEQIGAEIDAMTDEIIVGTGASGAQLEEMRQIAMGMSADVAVSMGDAGDIVQDFNTRLGLSGDDLDSVGKHAARLNQILGGFNYDKMATMFNVWGVGADEMNAKMDYMWGVSQNTGIGFDQLTSIMQSSGPTLQNLGFSFEESANMAGLLDKSGIDASSTMSRLSKALVELSEPGESAQDAFRRTIDEMQGFIDAGDTASAMDIATEIFGTRGAAQFIAALQSGALNMDELSDAALGASGSIDETYEATESWPELWERIQSSVKAALEPLASGVFEAFGAVVERIGAALTFLWEASEPVRAKLTEIADGIGQRLGPVIDAVSPGLATLGDILGGAVAGAFDAIATAVGIVADAISWLWDNVLKPFGDWLAETFGPLISGIGDTLGGIGDFVGGAMEAIGGNVESYGDAMVQTMGGDWQAMAMQTENAFGGMESTVASDMSSMEASTSNASANVKKSMDMREIPPQTAATFDSVEANMVEPVDSAVSQISVAPEDILDGFSGLGQRISNAFGSIDFPQAHIEYNTIDVVGKSIKIPKITWYAEGGFVTNPSLIGAGEAGPEMVLPQRGGLMDIFAGELSKRIGGSGSTVNVYLQYDAGEDASDLASDIARILDRRLAMEA